jgi:succinate-semialdehyde dehydrogenase/glutarate-semialdehyde dehydrogenase
MPSADLDGAIETAVQARIINNGQSCIAAKRFIVEESIYDDFKRSFTARMSALRLGDPLDERTEVGPLATGELLDTLEGQVRRTVEMGARVLVGGERLKEKGNFYPPTVLAEVPKASPAYSDELFGPVASLFRVHAIDGAIAVANDTHFGLASSCWTRDPAERDQFVKEIAAGMVFVNGMVASDPRIPFGGVKHSGYGRELGLQGIREFVNVKTVSIYGADGHPKKTE